MMLFDTLNEFDRLGSALFSAMNGVATPIGMPLDVHRATDRYVLKADLPGVDPKSIDVSVDGDWLTIRAERSTDNETNDGQWLLRERTGAAIERRVALREDVDVDAIEAGYDNGVLSISVPIAENSRRRRIPIGGGAAHPQQSLGQGDRVSASAAHAQGNAQGKAEPAHSLVS